MKPRLTVKYRDFADWLVTDGTWVIIGLTVNGRFVLEDHG